MKKDLPQSSRPGIIIIIFGIITFTILAASMLVASTGSAEIQSQNLQVQVDTTNLLNSLGILAFGIIIAGAARVLYLKIWRDQL